MPAIIQNRYTTSPLKEAPSSPTSSFTQNSIPQTITIPHPPPLLLSRKDLHPRLNLRNLLLLNTLHPRISLSIPR